MRDETGGSDDGGDGMQDVTVTCIGVGNLGAPLAARLGCGLAASTSVVLRLVTADMRETERAAEIIQSIIRELHACDAEARVSLVCCPSERVADAVRDAEYVVSCLPRSVDVLASVEQAFPCQSTGATAAKPKKMCAWIDVTSGDPSQSAGISAVLMKHGVPYVDCGVSGGPRGARDGTLTCMVGGSDDAFRAAMPVINTFSSKAVHVGTLPGAGHAVKCINNTLMSTNLVTASVGLAALRAFGVDAGAAIDAINSSSGRSWATINRLDKFVLTRGFDYGFAMDLLEKDIANGRALIEGVTRSKTKREIYADDAPAGESTPDLLLAPIASAHMYVRRVLSRCGNGAADHTLVAKYVEEEFGVVLKREAPRKPAAESVVAAVSLANCGFPIEGVCFDMAGTTVAEGGLVYATLRKTMREAGLVVADDEFHKWHGADKFEVLQHFCEAEKEKGVDARSLFEIFFRDLNAAYDTPGNVKAIDGSAAALQRIRDGGVKVGLQTGYAPDLARKLAQMTGLDSVKDHIVTATEAGAGRPAPFMVHAFMRDMKIHDARRVAKVGDTPRDMIEGKNAGCGLVVGVLSGAGTKAELIEGGADVVVADVTCILP